jgi:hypothetical protein
MLLLLVSHRYLLFHMDRLFVFIRIWFPFQSLALQKSDTHPYAAPPYPMSLSLIHVALSNLRYQFRLLLGGPKKDSPR